MATAGKRRAEKSDFATPVRGPRPHKQADDKSTPLKMNLEDSKESSIPKEPTEFSESLWPRFESKLNDWLQTKLEKKIEAIAETAMQNIMSTAEFKESVVDKVVNKVSEDVGRKFQNQLNNIYEEQEDLRGKDDDLEQYTRRNTIRINGVPFSKDEDTDQVVIDTINKELNIKIEKQDLDRTHRVGKEQYGKPRQIIVKFVSHNNKVKILKQRKLLKGKPITIHEDLTKGRLNAIKLLNDDQGCKFYFKKLWTIDGTIYVRLNDDKVKVLRSLCGLNKFISEITGDYY